MAILLSGDFHNNARGEISYIRKEHLILCYGKKLYKKIKYHVILGDAGFLWFNNEDREKENYNILSEREFPILCVMGNHEPVYGRKDLPEEDIGIGEKVIVVNKKNPFIAYLKRGKIYTIDGYKILVLGGALSIDKNARIEGLSWWKEEYWSKKEKKAIFELLKKEHEFDFVFSHTGPYNINNELENFGIFGMYGKIRDEVDELNEEIDKKIKHRGWFCGHWHYDYFDDKHYRDKDRKDKKYFYLYEHTVLLNENRLTVYNKTFERKI